jgi:hypothetical protein
MGYDEKGGRKVEERGGGGGGILSLEGGGGGGGGVNYPSIGEAYRAGPGVLIRHCVRWSILRRSRRDRRVIPSIGVLLFEGREGKRGR